MSLLFIFDKPNEKKGQAAKESTSCLERNILKTTIFYILMLQFIQEQMVKYIYI